MTFSRIVKSTYCYFTPLFSRAGRNSSPGFHVGNFSALAAARAIAKALLADRDEIDTRALSKVVSDGVAGEDLTLLLAMACRRSGGDAWDAFRGAARELLCEQPLDGNLIVLVNRLAAGQLPLVARR